MSSHNISSPLAPAAAGSQAASSPSAASPSSPARVAVLGAGRMGSALIRGFLQASHETHVWNRTASRLEPLTTLGARAAATPHAAIAAADLIIVNVLDYETGDRLLMTDAAIRALGGKTLVDLTSGSPRVARERDAWARAHGIAYLDGAIMGTPDFIGTPGGTILYAGSAALFARHRPVLLALGGNAVHVGEDAGHASALDSALLMQMWGALFGLLQGAAIAAGEQVPLDTFAAHLGAFKPVVDGAVTDVLTRLREGRLAGDEMTLATLAAHNSAFHHLLALCAERGLPRAIPEAFDQVIQAAMQAGHGADDFAVLSRFLR